MGQFRQPVAPHGVGWTEEQAINGKQSTINGERPAIPTVNR
jgi:hypothetical protein